MLYLLIIVRSLLLETDEAVVGKSCRVGVGWSHLAITSLSDGVSVRSGKSSPELFKLAAVRAIAECPVTISEDFYVRKLLVEQ